MSDLSRLLNPRAGAPVDLLATRAGLAPTPNPASPTEQMLGALLRAIYRQGRVQDVTSLAGTTATRVLDTNEQRSYFFIQNQSAVDTIVIRFGAQPSIGSSGQFVGVAIAPNFGFYEPIMVPVQECWIIASAASVPFCIVHG